jgi:cell division protein FtsB
MENLEVKVKDLSDENERLKSENTKLLTRIHTLEMEVWENSYHKYISIHISSIFIERSLENL